MALGITQVPVIFFLYHHCTVHLVSAEIYVIKIHIWVASMSSLGPNSTSSSKSIASTYVSAIYSHTTPHLIEKHKNNEDLNHMVQRQHLKNT